jgi:hypothetical protein
MIVRDTQKLFWKQWPIKVVISSERNSSKSSKSYFLGREERAQRLRSMADIVNAVKRELPNAGIRREGNVSVFVTDETELAQLVDLFGSRICEIWKPKNETAAKLLFEHTADVIRDRPWYGRFTMRARVLFTPHFKTNEALNFKAAVNSLDAEKWHAAGLLKDVISSDGHVKHGAWGQPLYLYLSDSEDAALLKLQCGTVIERFERIRPP